MDSKIINELMYIFNCSNSSDELFDAFNYAIKKRIGSLELYQHLLWNNSISKDELILYATKLCSVFPSFSYDINFLVAEIFASYSGNSDDYMTSLLYYKKAISLKPEVEQTYISVSNLYNKDLRLPPLEELIRLILEGVEQVKYKSKLYYALAMLYDRTGNTAMKKNFLQRRDKAALSESE